MCTSALTRITANTSRAVGSVAGPASFMHLQLPSCYNEAYISNSSSNHNAQSASCMQFHLQSPGQQQIQQQPPMAQQHQLPGPRPAISFAPEAEISAEPETSKKSKRGPVWKRRHLVIEQINELIEELDEIDSNIALQVCLSCPRNLLHRMAHISGTVYKSKCHAAALGNLEHSISTSENMSCLERVCTCSCSQRGQSASCIFSARGACPCRRSMC